MNFTEHIEEFLDGEPSPEQLATFANELRGSADRRREFRETVRLHVLARELLLEEVATPVLTVHWMRAGWLKAAAAVLMAAGLWLSIRHLRREPDRMTPDWLLAVQPANPEQEPEAMEAGYVDIGHGKMGRIMAKMIDPPPRPKTREERIAQFAEQFGFSFSMPTDIPGGWHLALGRALSTQRAELVYSNGRAHLQVLIWDDPGPAVDPYSHAGPDGVPLFIVSRRGGIGLAIRVDPAVIADANAIMDAFLPATQAR